MAGERNMGTGELGAPIKELSRRQQERTERGKPERRTGIKAQKAWLERKYLKKQER